MHQKKKLKWIKGFLHAKTVYYRFTKLVIMGAITQKKLDNKAITERHMPLCEEVGTWTHERLERFCGVLNQLSLFSMGLLLKSLQTIVHAASCLKHCSTFVLYAVSRVFFFYFQINFYFGLQYEFLLHKWFLSFLFSFYFIISKFILL